MGPCGLGYEQLTTPSTNGKLDVLYVGGYGRSGSTLLAYLLGQLEGYVVAGELKFIWQKGVKDNELCGCGEPFADCPFWRDVGQAAFGGWNEVDIDEVLSLQRRVTSSRSVSALLTGIGSSPSFARYAELLRRLYGAILSVSGGRIVVDTSKTPVEALILARVPGLQCRTIHLVRDGRGVAFSWSKRGVRRPEVVGEEAVMLDYSPLYVAPRWVYGNLFFELLRTRVPTARLRYEDLGRSPQEYVESALQGCGAPSDDAGLEALGSGRVTLGALHTIGGNPMRFTAGETSVRADDAWKREMTPGSRRSFTAVTWPLLKLYGYSLRADAKESPLPAHVSRESGPQQERS
jgi:hypothetical protein